MNVCLIGGSGRSGTTILSKVLSLHPEVTDVPEWRFLIDPDGIIDFYSSVDNWSPYHFDVRLRRLEKLLHETSNSNLFNKIERIFNQFVLQKINFPKKIISRYSEVNVKSESPNFELYVERLIKNLIDFSYYGEWIGTLKGSHKLMYYQELQKYSKENLSSIFNKFLSDVMNDVLTKQGKKYYLEKNTWNILWFDKILEILPQAKLLHIYRDPRDVVASYVTQSWMPSEPIKSSLIYKDIMNQWEYIKSLIPDESYYELSLESLVNNTEEELRMICDFFGIPWDYALLEMDLSKSHSGRWKREFTTHQQSEINSILGELVKKLGYE